VRDQSLKRPSTSRVLCRRDQDARKDDCGDRHPRACRRHDSQHHRQTVPRHGMASNAATAEPFAREESFGFTAVDLRLVLRTLLRQHANLVSERLDLALQCFDLRLLLAHSRRHLLALLLNEALTPLRAALWALTSGRRGGGAALIFPPPARPQKLELEAERLDRINPPSRRWPAAASSLLRLRSCRRRFGVHSWLDCQGRAGRPCRP
jgi:hypothetical protein